MLDFLVISKRATSNKTIEIYPKFIVGKSQDLMIRGKQFYAIWDEESKLWRTDECEAIKMIDREIDQFAKKEKEKITDTPVKVLHLWDSDTGMIDKWIKYCQKQMIDNYTPLDESLTFLNSAPRKEDYASKHLPYAIEDGDISAYNELIGTLYTPEERHKLEWAVGSIFNGDSKHLQKFVVLYGSAGAGKSTFLNIVQKLFEGYYSVFDAQALGQATNAFALEAFKKNPLVGIQHDGDLSRIEDNTKLNSLVSHELMTVNEKHKSLYESQFKTFLFMGTNRPVRITDAKSGLLRRLIDVSPSGEKVSQIRYRELNRQIDFELGAIAQHCKDVYEDDPHFYDAYTPVSMMDASNDFYNFVIESFDIFKNNEVVTLKTAWELYNEYVEDSRLQYHMNKRNFKEELKNYFSEFKEQYRVNDVLVKNAFIGFRTDRFEYKPKNKNMDLVAHSSWLIFAEGIESVFDKVCYSYPAQLANDKGTPIAKWDDVKTTLADIDTEYLHYVKVPENHIVIDFDIPDENGEKSFIKNFEAASKWPKTYAEVSKSGAGIHLHYIYSGDPNELSRVYADHIEIKVYTGGSSLRRKLSKCNNLPISRISSGLPLREKKGDKMVDFEIVRTEASMRKSIIKALNKEVHSGTKPNIDFIKYILDDAYNQGISFDLTDMRPAVMAFAANSTNQSEYCLKVLADMKFRSKDMENIEEKTPEKQFFGPEIDPRPTINNDDIIFFDVEIYPPEEDESINEGLFLVCWKKRGKGNPKVRMYNPKPYEIEELIKNPLVGFNCRNYDNHMLYARMMGYTNKQLYDLSSRLVSNDKKNKDRNCYFSEAYNLSYTDVYDFASAGHKQSLKKFEIELGIHHQEMGIKWDEPAPKDKWEEIGDYCCNDVDATEATFEYLAGDWAARLILADLAGGIPNMSTNSLSRKLIFGNERNPQKDFVYRNLAEPVYELPEDVKAFLDEHFPEMMCEAFGDKKSILPYFEGYEFDRFKRESKYQGFVVGEGGFVWAEPGMYWKSKTYDVSGMHPHSAMAECLFGPVYTKILYDIVQARLGIKHKDWDAVNQMLDHKLAPYVQKIIDGTISGKDLSNALKTVVNSIYGLTSAGFDNAFKDPRNIDNIVAKRGALFMIDLKDKVERRGGKPIHIKTDSIKLLDPTPELEEFVLHEGKRYGYTFEVEHSFEKICLVNNAVYIAKLAEDDPEDPGKWTATGKQFAVPYVFKTLFSKEPIIFEDLCETKEVKTAIYLDFKEGLPDVTEAEKCLEIRRKYLGTDHRFTRRENDLLEQFGHLTDEELMSEIAKGHRYHFVGKVGNFCPIKPGCGGAELVRTSEDKDGNIKYDSVTGAKGYLWMEAEMVKELGKEGDVDMSYHSKMVDDAIDAIAKFGNPDEFLD